MSLVIAALKPVVDPASLTSLYLFAILPVAIGWGFPQQRFVHTIITLKLAQRALDRGDDEARPLVDQALDHAEEATTELRELAHGILPSALVQGGLAAGVGALASRVSVPVNVAVPGERFAPEIEASALVGLEDRVAAMGGQLQIESPPGGGT